MAEGKAAFWFAGEADHGQFDIYGPFDSYRKAEIVATVLMFSRTPREVPFVKIHENYWERKDGVGVYISMRPINDEFETFVKTGKDIGVPEELLKE